MIMMCHSVDKFQLPFMKMTIMIYQDPAVVAIYRCRMMKNMMCLDPVILTLTWVLLHTIFACKVYFIYSHSQGVPLISSWLPSESGALIGQKGLTRPRIELVPTDLFFVVKEKMLTAITSEPPSEFLQRTSHLIHKPFAANRAVTHLESSYNPIRSRLSKGSPELIRGTPWECE